MNLLEIAKAILQENPEARLAIARQLVREDPQTVLKALGERLVPAFALPAPDGVVLHPSATLPGRTPPARRGRPRKETRVAPPAPPAPAPTPPVSSTGDVLPGANGEQPATLGDNWQQQVGI